MNEDTLFAASMVFVGLVAIGVMLGLYLLAKQQLAERGPTPSMDAVRQDEAEAKRKAKDLEAGMDDEKHLRSKNCSFNKNDPISGKSQKKSLKSSSKKKAGASALFHVLQPQDTEKMDFGGANNSVGGYMDEENFPDPSRFKRVKPVRK